MRFTVTWEPAAEDILAALWSVAPDRAAFSADADWIEETLRRSGDTAGETFMGSDQSRILRTRTIAVIFTVSMEDRIVSFTNVLKRRSERP